MYGRLRAMITDKNESFVNFALMKDVRGAEKDGVIHLNVPLDNVYEEPHLSELERLLRNLDEVETYVAVKALAKHQRNTLIRTLDYMQKKGE